MSRENLINVTVKVFNVFEVRVSIHLRIAVDGTISDKRGPDR